MRVPGTRAASLAPHVLTGGDPVGAGLGPARATVEPLPRTLGPGRAWAASSRCLFEPRLAGAREASERSRLALWEGLLSSVWGPRGRGAGAQGSLQRRLLSMGGHCIAAAPAPHHCQDTPGPTSSTAAAQAAGGQGTGRQSPGRGTHHSLPGRLGHGSCWVARGRMRSPPSLCPDVSAHVLPLSRAVFFQPQALQ